MQTNIARKVIDAVVGFIIIGALSFYMHVRRAFSRRHRTALDELNVRSLLVIKLCCLGDGVLAVPAIRALKNAYPQAKLTLICTPRSKDAFVGQPFVDELVVLNLTGLAGMGEMLRSAFKAFGQAIRAMRKARPDIAVDLDLYYKVTPILAFLSGAPIRAGFDTAGKNRGGLFTHKAARDPDKHELHCFLDILGTLGVYTDDESLELWSDPAAALSIVTKLEAYGILADTRYAVLAPGSSRNWPVKRWEPERFAAVGQHMINCYDMPVLLVGAGFEHELAEAITERIGEGAVNIAGSTSIRETIEALRNAAIVISNDSGPMHLAAAVDTPVVGIFGPTNVAKWRPFSTLGRVVVAEECCDRAPCYYLSAMPCCDASDCLGKIPVEQVIQTVDELLALPANE